GDLVGDIAEPRVAHRALRERVIVRGIYDGPAGGRNELVDLHLRPAIDCALGSACACDEIADDHEAHSGVIFASRITYSHCFSSSRMSFSNSAGVVDVASAPCASSLSRVSGVCNTLTIAALSFATIAGGVLAGTSAPYHEFTTQATPCSAIVGISGAAMLRLSRAIARAVNRPDLTCCNAAGIDTNANCTCPPIVSLTAGPPPLYGTWMMSTPALSLKSSPAM